MLSVYIYVYMHIYVYACVVCSLIKWDPVYGLHPASQFQNMRAITTETNQKKGKKRAI